MTIININRIPLYATLHYRHTRYGETILVAVEINGIVYPVLEKIGDLLYLGGTYEDPFKKRTFRSTF